MNQIINTHSKENSFQSQTLPYVFSFTWHSWLIPWCTTVKWLCPCCPACPSAIVVYLLALYFVCFSVCYELCLIILLINLDFSQLFLTHVSGFVRWLNLHINMHKLILSGLWPQAQHWGVTPLTFLAQSLYLDSRC